MELVATASFITAFVAGVAALFAPCCIGVLLPSYLASVFKTKTKIFLMTFVYYLGLLTVFVPLGLGMAWLGGLFSRYHSVFFTLAGLFLVALGLALVLGRTAMLPIKVHPRLEGHDFGSLYVLGIFSGIATSCCAPVLAGVLALSALPGSMVMGALYALVFVTGLVLPLFIMAVVIDRANMADWFKRFRRKVTYTLAGRKISVNLSHLVAGAMYAATGIFILLFERANPDGLKTMGYQIQINLVAAEFTRAVSRFTGSVPQAVWAVVFTLIFAGIAWVAYRQAKADTVVKEDQK